MKLMKKARMKKLDKVTQTEKMAMILERMRLGDYVTNMNKTGRIIWINLIGGISRGVGLTIGATLIIAILFKVLTAIISMKIPYLTEMLQEVVQIVKTTPGLEKVAGNSVIVTTPEQKGVKNGHVAEPEPVEREVVVPEE